MKHTLESSHAGLTGGSCEGEFKAPEERSIAFRTLLCNLFLKKTLDWPLIEGHRDQLQRIRGIVEPFAKLLEAKRPGYLKNLGHNIEEDSQTQEVLTVYETLRDKLFHQKSSLNFSVDNRVGEMSDIDYRCSLDEIGRCVKEYGRLICVNKRHLSISALQQYSDMCFFYYMETKNVRAGHEMVPFYIVQTAEMSPMPKKVEPLVKKKEIVYDEAGLQRIKTLSIEPQDPNMPNRAKVEGKPALPRQEARKDQTRHERTIHQEFKNSEHEKYGRRRTR